MPHRGLDRVLGDNQAAHAVHGVLPDHRLGARQQHRLPPQPDLHLVPRSKVYNNIDPGIDLCFRLKPLDAYQYPVRAQVVDDDSKAAIPIGCDSRQQGVLPQASGAPPMVLLLLPSVLRPFLGSRCS